MTANPNPRERLDAMVREKMGGVSHSHPTTPFKLAGALGHVALDLLQERDALCAKLAESEAKVKELSSAVVDLWDLLRECSDEDANEEGVDHLNCGSDSCSNFLVLNRHKALRESLGPLKQGFKEWEEARKKGAEHGE